jgi:carbon-monoxide dehydrogenase large subunit
MATTEVAPSAAGRPFGSAIKRREDPRLITGRGSYVDDLQLPGVLYMALARSPHAHARIRSINVAAARGMAGVVEVFTGADLEGKVGMLPCGWVLPDIKMPPHPPVAKDKVRCVGDAVAVVLADSRTAAKDAAEAIEVDYEVLPAVVDEERALAAGAPILHEEFGTNLSFTWTIAGGDADQALKDADRVIKQRIVNQRLIPNAMEPRAVAGHYLAPSDELTLWTSSQVPHLVRLLLALTAGIPEQKLRVIAPDVGGGFGSKLYLYAEEMLVACLSRQTGRAIKWTEERRENYLATTHGRACIQDVEIACSNDGAITGLKIRNIANLGAYLSTFAPGIPTVLFGVMLSGAYKIPNVHCQVDGVFTNTVPVDAYRGAGRPEAAHLMERVLDLVADATGLDPAEVRRKNFIPPGEFPFTTATGVTYDSGEYAGALDLALREVGYEALKREQAERRARNDPKQLGIGLSSYVEICGMAPSQVLGAVGGQAGGWESATVRVHPTGKVTVLSGASSHGQGHQTTFAQIVAEELGVPVEDVDIVQGDTAKVQFGIGTFGSRSTAVGGTAIYRSVQKIKDKAVKIAAHLLEVSPDDVEYVDGRMQVKGAPEQSRTIQEISLTAFLAHNYPAGLEPGLEETTFHDPSNFTWPFGTHICVTEVDTDTGRIEVLRYVAVDDCGRIINPLIVDGQVHGGITQGMAQALYEDGAYDENGQLIAGSMMDYAVPNAKQVPSFETHHTVTPSPVNPMGIKGIGEAGTIGASAAVVNSVVDALSHLGITHLDMPLRPERVWRAIQEAQGGK